LQAVCATYARNDVSQTAFGVSSLKANSLSIGVDECTGPVVAPWLRDHSEEMFAVREEARGMADDDVFPGAYSEN